MTAFACIATRNEEATIGPLVEYLVALDLRVIVEDESDLPITAVAAQHAGAEAHWTPGTQRTGLGPSLMRAWRRALQEGASAIVQLDAGGSHRAEDAARVLESLPGHNAIIGSRFCQGGVYIGNPRRAWASRLAGQMCTRRALARGWGASYRWGLPYDWTSGLRAFTPTTARWLLCGEYRFCGHAWQIDTLARLLRDRAAVSEVPITYTAGRSSLRLRGAWEAFKAWRTL